MRQLRLVSERSIEVQQGLHHFGGDHTHLQRRIDGGQQKRRLRGQGEAEDALPRARRVLRQCGPGSQDSATTQDYDCQVAEDVSEKNDHEDSREKAGIPSDSTLVQNFRN